MSDLSAIEKNILQKNHDGLTDAEFDELRKNVIKDLSYSPYSKFRVGACVLTESGEYINGANIENASYGACICAERVTITKAVTMGFTKFKAIAVSTDLKDKIGSPCGICRQVIREFGRSTPVYLFNADGSDFYKVVLKELLPFSFGPSDLGEPEFDEI